MDIIQTFFGQNCFLGGVHTTDGRTVGVFLVPGSDALQPSNSLWWSIVRWTEQKTFCRPRTADESFILHTVYYIQIATITKFGQFKGIGQFVSHSQDNGPDMKYLFPRFLIEVNRICGANIHAAEAIFAVVAFIDIVSIWK